MRGILSTTCRTTSRIRLAVTSPASKIYDSAFHGVETQTIMAGTFPADAREKLRQQFLDQPEENLTNRWDDLWQQKLTPWDKNGPSLALKDAITDRPDVFGTAIKDDSSKTRKRALVPGCGSGYDVFLLASLGYDTYGLDAAPTAVNAAKQIQAEIAADERYAVHDSEIGRGESKVILQDFFKDDFQAHTGGAGFDVIFDYTFLCALPPDLRPRWAQRMSQLLGPLGKLICLEWPLGKDPKLGGPPFGVTPELFGQLLSRPGKEVKYDDAGVVVVEDQSGEGSDHGLVTIDRFLPSRTHESTKGNDHVSIWQHQQGPGAKAAL
ncbi:hypothetical protein DOTSEDRAFT_43091 [Dothistroma septosporum NZE10]|uniref:Uncharacterized protein n=1 Tax=Dothistroma septosporum (strain NZE10 / CBS 128990) TaxID=675120 RepID=N1PW39_DOTSN|nr:hypothetical protein DOTSEDRAFT_43091 [Dothistroma septosporum NZE10]